MATQPTTFTAFIQNKTKAMNTTTTITTTGNNQTITTTSAILIAIQFTDTSKRCKRWIRGKEA